MIVNFIVELLFSFYALFLVFIAIIGILCGFDGFFISSFLVFILNLIALYPSLIVFFIITAFSMLNLLLCLYLIPINSIINLFILMLSSMHVVVLQMIQHHYPNLHLTISIPAHQAFFEVDPPAFSIDNILSIYFYIYSKFSIFPNFLFVSSIHIFVQFIEIIYSFILFVRHSILNVIDCFGFYGLYLVLYQLYFGLIGFFLVNLL